MGRRGVQTLNKKNPEELRPKKDPTTNRYPDGQHIWGKNQNEWREAEILSAKKSGEVWLYYLHFVDFNRRMDTWVAEKDVCEVHPDGEELKLEGSDVIAAEKEKIKRKLNDKEVIDVVEFVEEDYGELAGMDAQSIMEHESVTKIKNVSNIQLGRYRFETWYYSPIPKEYFAQDPVLDCLYFCEFSLDFYVHESELARHYKRCPLRHPPGDEIYRDHETRLAMFEVDGSKSKFYAQNLCYLAKFFLDHKTLHFDTEPFLFYILCEFDDRGYHLVGFFSKEKYSESGYNLACILTLPPYQKRGYGTFLISMSYEISKKEMKVGSPEKPLSDLGQISYRSYWSRCLLEELKLIQAEGAQAISIMDISLRTALKNDDIISTLEYLGILKESVKDDLSTIFYDLTQIDAAIAKLGPNNAPKIKPELIHWSPLKVNVARDKWSMKSKSLKKVRVESNAATSGNHL